MGKKNKTIKVRTRRTLREAIAVVPASAKGLGILLVSGVVTCIAAFQALSMVRADACLTFSPDGVDVRGLPAWLDEESAVRLRTPAVLPRGIHVLDRTPLEKLRAYYLANEWVAAVESLEYVVPGTAGGGGIVGRLRLREPLCAVGLKEGEYYYADEKGRRLGGRLGAPPPEELRLPVVQWASRVAPRGEAWGEDRRFVSEDDRVVHGFYIAALLRQVGLHTGLPHWIARIDVSNVGRRDCFEVALVTEPGHAARLVWGRTMRSEYVGGRVQEAPTKDKVEHLRQILSGARACAPGEEIRLFEAVARRQAEVSWLSPSQP
jgi:hypothetical protein